MPRSRGPFNDTMSVYSQVNGIVALVPYATGVPCRNVLQTMIDNVMSPFDLRTAWITYDAVAPVQPTVTIFGSTVTVIYDNADVIELASLPGIFWYTLYTEIVQPEGEPTYLRSSVAERWYP